MGNIYIYIKKKALFIGANTGEKKFIKLHLAAVRVFFVLTVFLSILS